MAEPTEQPNNIETGKTAPHLPQVESPPLSPGDEGNAPAMNADAAPEIKPPEPAMSPSIENATPTEKLHFRIPSLRMPELQFPRINFAKPKFAMSRRLRRRAALAATVLLAAGFGAAIGGVVTHNAPPAIVAKPDTAALEETYALQKQVARLSKELSSLKTGIDTAARDSRTQIAKITERLDRPPEVTGSVNKQAAVAPSSAPAIEKPEFAPIPQPRPAIVQAPPIVQDWAVLDARNGRALVTNRGEVYEVTVGNPLPGLGGVEAIRRDGNRWVVVTAKGIIMPAQSSAAMPPRGGYVPYYQRY